MEWFTGLNTYTQIIVGVFIPLISAIFFLIRRTSSDLIPSFKLLRKYYAGHVESHMYRVSKRIIYSIIATRFLPITNKLTSLDLIRSEIEFECLEPYPKHEVHETAKNSNEKIREWKKNRKRAVHTSKIQLPHAGIIHNNFTEIDRYFDILELLDLESTKNIKGFVIKVELADGYIAPIHLLAGLLQKFDEDWVKILSTLEADYRSRIDDFGNDSAITEIRNLRAIQGFIFNCWLQWGQSIPLCSNQCNQFRGELTTLQYGYGDEDQSIELVDNRRYFKDLFNRNGNEFVIRARVTGRITSTRFLDVSDLKNFIGDAHKNSWSNDREGNSRLILDIRDENNKISQHDSFPVYYSAYVWAMFIILKKDPTSPATGNTWFDLIPFFEHGNIADKKTFLFAKQQLVQKTIAGFKHIVTTWINDQNSSQSNVSIEDYPLRFYFACSLDYSGCGQEKDFIDSNSIYSNDSNQNIRNMLKAAVNNDNLFKQKDIIKFDEPRNTTYSSCNLPTLINDYFEHVKNSINN